jgi:hypothetical protein
MSTTVKTRLLAPPMMRKNFGEHGSFRKRNAEPSCQYHGMVVTVGFDHQTSFVWKGTVGYAKTALPPPKRRNT